MKLNSRVGETKTMNCGEEATIIKYNSYSNICVEFKKYNEVVETNYSNFKNGIIKSKFTPSIYGIGYLGVGDYKSYNNRKPTNEYICWSNAMKRCYSKEYHTKHKSYKDCNMCEEWLNFQVFAKWYDENYYEVKGQIMDLDKDILCKGNKIYSPSNCVFVPQNINKLFIRSDSVRGLYPIGVSYNVCNDRYISRYSIYNNNIKSEKYLGSFKTPEEAFEIYKDSKEDYIKEIADEYKDVIPLELYMAMYRYKIEIND